MKHFKSWWLFLFCISFSIVAQETEVAPPFNIKTVSFVQSGQNTVPIFQLGDSFEFQFDDLYANEADYYYTITHCDYDWNPSQLSKNEYIVGFDDQRIQEYINSSNCLQVYSHYRLTFPNKFTTGFRVSGNYILTILNNDKEVVLTRKFILYENMVSVPLQIKKARNVNDIPYKQNLDFSIKTEAFTFQNPLKNVKVMLLQNGNINSAITNIKPMYTIGNELIYKYDAETQFWGGNEYLYFDNKIIRNANNAISYVDTNGGLYNAHLYTNEARANKPYTYWPDVNGNFVINNVGAQNNQNEADYAWVYFSLSAPSNYSKGSVYVTGMFNNYALTDENKMEYNTKTGLYEKAILIKQGFTNYKYTLVDNAGKIDNQNAIDGNHFQTENNYIVLTYYRENNQRYDRIIGRGIASSTDMIN